MTDRDRELLAFAAEHRFVLPDHARALLGVSARAARGRLRALAALGTLAHEPPSSYRITGKGLALIGSELPRPQIDWRCYQHDVGLAWLWLAARRGTWGPMREVISERRLRSRDARRTDGEAPLAVRLGGVGPGGRERLHYPDLVLITAPGRRIALELELSPKRRVHREKILAGYGADARIDAILYLVEDVAIARSLMGSARRLGVADRVHVQPVRWSLADGQAGARAAAGRAKPAAESAAHHSPVLSA
jgi:hypothetical protein